MEEQLTRYVNPDTNIEYFVLDEVSYDQEQILTKGGFRRSQVIDPETGDVVKVLIRKMQPH